MRRLVAVGVVAYAAAVPACLAAQSRDSATTLDDVVVTADRSPAAIQSATASVTRIDREQLQRLPHATVADVLRLAPGFALVDVDGLGFDPQLMVRGFHGGGEAEYVLVLLDGRPVNQLHTGVVAWEALPPLEAIESIEIVRGSSSALYGDAAVGAVINVITRDLTSLAPRWSVAGGSHESWRANADVAGDFLWREASLAVGVDRTDGFRDHAGRLTGRADAAMTLASGAAGRLSLHIQGHWREFDQPGPLLDSLMSEDRSGSDPFFRFDHSRDRELSVRVRGERHGGRFRLTGSIGGDRRRLEAVRTIPIATDYADTKARDLTMSLAVGTIQLDLSDTPMPGDDELVIGIDASGGSSESVYYRMARGRREEYVTREALEPFADLASFSKRGPRDAAGDATRKAAGLFMQHTMQLSPAVRVSAGGRYDRIADDFVPRNPSDEDPVRASHDAISPKVGINVRYIQSRRSTGHAYLTAARTFKAPTLDQLFDQRSVTFPFPPFNATSSNPLLEPQHGVHLDGGVYQSAMFGASALLSATISAYHMDMEDELDFDVATLRYVNIGRSRHRGLEAGFTLTGVGTASLWLNHTVQSAIARSGAYAGNALKAIPEHVTTAGASLTPVQSLDVRVIASHSRDIFLDDANTVELPAFTRVDAAAAYRFHAVEAFVDVRNAFGARYSTTGFLDPAGSGAVFFHPAAERVVHLGIRSGR